MRAFLGLLLSWVAIADSMQGTPTKPPPEQPAKLEVELALAAPSGPIHEWSASEWSLTFTNATLRSLPVSDYVLGSSGYGGAKVAFEIVNGSKRVRFLSSMLTHSAHSPSPDKDHLFGPGHSAELPVVIHGGMVIDDDARARGEDVFVRFAPAFDAAGAYSVTAILNWDGKLARSNTVTVQVADAPEDAKRALKGLKDLAQAGVCVDVQGMQFNDPPALVERIAKFVAKEEHTLYGEQARLGLARAMLAYFKEDVSLGDPKHPELGAKVTIERVKSFVPDQLPKDFGLEGSLARLRQAIATEEAKSK